MKKKQIFISCVSDEFHRKKEGKLFFSYRSELAGDLDGFGYDVITQEGLPDGSDDLLVLLEVEIKKCDAVVHLIGNMTGGFPAKPAVRRLLRKYPNFLGHRPEFRAALGECPELSYTQWEAILALHFKIRCLIYRADDTADRSPFYAPTPESIELQKRHWERLDNDGKARAEIDDHQGFCRRVTASLHQAFEPDRRIHWADLIDQWKTNLSDWLVKEAPFRPVQFEDPDTARDKALKRLAATTDYSPDQILGILEQDRADLEESTAFHGMKGEESLWDLALSYTAEGRFDRAAKIAQRVAYKADETGDVETAINAFQFAAHAYTRAYQHDLAIAAFENACQRIDRTADPHQWAEFHQALGMYYYETGHLTEAEAPLRGALETFEAENGSTHPDALHCRLDLAKWLLSTGNAPGAEVASEFTLRTIETWTDENQRLSLQLSALSIYGLALKAQGHLEEAEPVLRQDLVLSERMLGTEHPSTLSSVNNLAGLLKAKGDLDGAEPLCRRAREARERVLGAEHPSTLTSVNNLALLLQAKGDLAEAEPLYRRAREARERVLGAEHPDTLTSVNNLAGLLRAKRDLAGAEPLFRRALKARERVLGAEHPDTLTSVNNLAALLDSKGDLAGAEPLYRRALEARERVLGAEHPDTLTSVNNLAALLRAKGDLAGAEPLSRRALEARERVLGAEHPDTLTSVNNLAFLLDSKGDLAGAEPLFLQAWEGFRDKLGPEHPTTKGVKGNLDGCRAEMEEEG